MDQKKNGVLLGCIIALIGILAILINLTSLTLFDVMLAGGGAAYLLLYRTKRKSWALILGGYLTYFGVAQIFNTLTGWAFSEYLFTSMFFIVPGMLFFVLFFNKNKRGLLIPASILVWLGLYFMFRDVPAILPITSNLPLYMSAACMTVYLFTRSHAGKWPLYTSFALCALGVANIFAFASAGLFGVMLRVVMPVAIVVFGVLVAVVAMRRK